MTDTTLITIAHREEMTAMARNIRAGYRHATDYDDEVAVIYAGLAAAYRLASQPAPDDVPGEEATRLKPAPERVPTATLPDHIVARLNDQACDNNFGRQGEWGELNEDGKAWARELANLAYSRGKAEAPERGEAYELASQVVHLLEGAKLIPSAYDRLPRVFELIRAIGFEAPPQADKARTEGRE